MTRATSNIGWIKHPIAMCLFTFISPLFASTLIGDSLPALEYKFIPPFLTELSSKPLFGASIELQGQKLFAFFATTLPAPVYKT